MEGDIAAKSFIRFMMPGFTEELDVPRGFSKNVSEGEKWTLKTRKGKWKVNVGRNDDKGGICLKDGWTKFVSEHHLSIGDLVQFEQISGTNFRFFNVTIFDSSACEKEFSRDVVVGKSSRNKKGNSDGKHFVLTMTPNTARRSARVFIPTSFLKASTIGKKYSSLTLRDPLGRKWPVELVISTTVLKVEMYKGWHDFYVTNQLKLGDDCLFQLDCASLQSTNPVLDVQIVRYNK